MATALSKNSTLTVLDISHNSLKFEGVRCLATALLTNTTLTTLDLRWTSIKDEGAERLAAALATNCTLTTLCIFGMYEGAAGHSAVEMKIREITMQKLENTISDTLQNQIIELVKSAPDRKRAAEAEAARLRAEEEARLRAEEASRLRAEQKERLKAVKRAKNEPPFLPVLEKFKISSACRDTLFDAHGLKLSRLKFLTVEDLSNAVETNNPPLSALKIRALFDELKTILSSSTPSYSSLVSPSSPTSLPSFSQPHLIPLSELRYPIVGKPLGTGAFGSVYVGEYKEMRVAVKELKTDNHEVAADFLKEAGVMTNLRSPLLVKLVGVCLDPQIMVMELMRGGSLYDLLHNSSSELPWKKKIDILYEISRGIQFLHLQSVAHRDLKPANILLSQDHQQVKLADFGFSRKVNLSGLLETVSVRGTPFYMSPELVSPSSPSNINGLSCDIYALGIIIWEVGFRKIPHHKLLLNRIEFSSKVVNERLRPSIDLQAGLSRDFVTLMMRCWDHDPSLRPGIDQVLEALLPCKEHPPGANPFIPSKESLAPIEPDYGAFSIGSNFAGPSSSLNLDNRTSLMTSVALTAGQVSGEWTISKWLISLRLADLIPIFEREDLIDPFDIKSLTEANLVEMGITKIVARNRILNFAAEL